MVPISRIDCEQLNRTLRDMPIGHTIHHTLRTPSTMALAHAWADQMRVTPSGAPMARASGTIFVAEEQTAGRGRLQRRWETPYGTALLLSVLLCPPHLPQPITQASMLAAVSVTRALTAVHPELTEHLALKWPNDVLLRKHRQSAGNDTSKSAPHAVQNIHSPASADTDVAQRTQNTAFDDEYGKVAGILCELSFRQNEPDYAVLGIGINVNQNENELPAAPEPAPQPTSLRCGLGHMIDRTNLLAALCRAMSHFIMTSPSNSSVWSEWRSQLATLGRHVTVRSASDYEVQWSGIATDVTQDGDLVVTNENGTQRTFSAGDVSLR